MKFVRFDAGSGPRLGAIAGESIIDLAKAAFALGPEIDLAPEQATAWFGNEMDGLIAGGERAVEFARRLGARFAPEKAGVRLLAPIGPPSKIIAVGLNYMDHCREQKVAPPQTPVLFSKAPSALIGPGEPIYWPDGLTRQADPEVELGVVIGRKTKAAPEKEALQSVFGYTIVNDVSARDLQFGDKQWVRGKSLDTFCPAGPCLVTRDEMPDPQNLALKCIVNGRAWQDSSTKEMIFPVAALISFISAGITLLPGDLIATGTPHGVGVFQNPPVFLGAGDTIRMEIENIGVLENPVAGPR